MFGFISFEYESVPKVSHFPWDTNWGCFFLIPEFHHIAFTSSIWLYYVFILLCWILLG